MFTVEAKQPVMTPARVLRVQVSTVALQPQLRFPLFKISLKRLVPTVSRPQLFTCSRSDASVSPISDCQSGHGSGVLHMGISPPNH
jgi:hypothetical protein